MTINYFLIFRKTIEIIQKKFFIFLISVCALIFFSEALSLISPKISWNFFSSEVGEHFHGNQVLLSMILIVIGSVIQNIITVISSIYIVLFSKAYSRLHLLFVKKLLPLVGIVVIKFFVCYIGTMLFIIPGYVMMVLLIFAEFYLILGNLNVKNSIIHSVNLGKKYFKNLFMIIMGVDVFSILIIFLLQNSFLQKILGIIIYIALGLFVKVYFLLFYFIEERDKNIFTNY